MVGIWKKQAHTTQKGAARSSTSTVVDGACSLLAGIQALLLVQEEHKRSYT
jgi:hypothetical protein